MDYATLKLVHQSAVVLSLVGFFVRGIGSLSGGTWVRRRVTRIVPVVVYTVLLASAIALAWALRLPPLDTPWLLAKIVALVGYIALGVVALKPGAPLGLRAAAWVAALGVFGYIASVAISKDPRGFLAAI